jgi:CDP-diacylglycerol---glycerol-3-phosphate 3-phosphatidyltransferase
MTLLGITGTFLTSYTRARAEALGIDAKVGMMQRPERVVLLSAPQAFFGLALDGWVLMGIVTLLTVTACITAVQRIVYVHRVTQAIDHPELHPAGASVPPAVATGGVAGGRDPGLPS